MNANPFSRHNRCPSLRPLAAAVVLALGAASSAQAQSLLDLFQAARDHDASYLSAVANAKATNSRGNQAWAGMLPQISYTQDQFETKNRRIANPPTRDSDSQALTIKQPLFQMADFLGVAQGSHTRDIAERQLQTAEHDLILRTTEAYFDVLSTNDNLGVIQSQKQAVSEQLASAKRNFEVGTSTITDSREAQARYDLVVAQEIAAKNDHRIKLLALEQLVGISNVQPRSLKFPVNLPNLENPDLNTWLAQAQANNNQLQQAQSAKSIASLESKKAMSRHLPSLDLIARQRKSTGFDPTNEIFGRTENTSVGIQLEIPLFVGFAHHNRIRETLHLQVKSQADLEKTQRDVEQATRTVFYNIQSGLSQVKALEAAEESSQVSLDANQLGYQVGVRINIDVLNAQTQLYQTKRDLAQARYDVLLDQLRLKQISGQLSGQDLLSINTLLAP